MDDNDRMRFYDIMQRTFIIDPEATSEEYEAAFKFVIGLNYRTAEIPETEFRATADAMLDHVDTVLAHPELFGQ